MEVEFGGGELSGREFAEVEFHDRPGTGVADVGIGGGHSVGAPASEVGVGGLVSGEVVDPDIVGWVEGYGLGRGEEDEGGDHVSILTGYSVGSFVRVMGS